VGTVLEDAQPRRADPVTSAPRLRWSGAGRFGRLLEALWTVEPSRLADELAVLGLGASSDPRLNGLADAERAEVSDFVDFLAARHTRTTWRGSRPAKGRM
jgi:hypothetical protein